MYLSKESYTKMISRLKNDEGFSGKIYPDSKGFLTLGFGFNLTKQEIPIDIASDWLDFLVTNVEHEIEQNISFWSDLNEARQSVLINMAYQMGIGGLLQFRDMLKALGLKDYNGAAIAMKDSVWYREFTARASRLVKIMQSGEF